MMASCGVKVIARFRPISDNEKRKLSAAQNGDLDIQIRNSTTIDIRLDRQQHTFVFDGVYDSNCLQSDIYEFSAKPCINDVLEGYNGTIFAYGQTGSGKTFTMFGVKEDDTLKGVIPRACSQIFSHIDEDTRDVEWSIKCSFLEIYKEKIYDLLSQNTSKGNLKVRESPSKGVWVEGLTEEFIGCEEDILELISFGESSRTIASTEMNARSSRSHSLFMIIIEQKLEDGSIKTGRLNLVDLAGSERVAKTGASGQQLDEAKDINKSLSCLGKCIFALSEASTKGVKNVHVPFRESQLTRILQESLGGNTKTTLIITCSPAVYNADETVSTLRFGASAKAIKTTVTVNKKRSIEELENLLNNLQKELTAMRKYVKRLENQIIVMQSPDYNPSTASPFDFKKARGTFSELIERPTTPLSKSGVKLGNESPGGRMRASSVDTSEDEDYDPLALAETKAKFDNLKKSTDAQIDQLRCELKDLQEREQEHLYTIKVSTEKYEKTSEKLEILRMKSERDFTEFSLKNQQLEEDLRLKVAEGDESIIVLYSDNERLERELVELRDRVKSLQSSSSNSRISPIIARRSGTSTPVLNQSGHLSVDGQPPPPSANVEEPIEEVDAVLLEAGIKIQELEDTVEELSRKTRNLEETNTSLNKKVELQKERLSQNVSQIAEMNTSKEILKEQIDELQKDKRLLEETLEKKAQEFILFERATKDRFSELEKQLTIKGRGKVFRPVRRKNAYFEAFAEKIDIKSHISTLKKTNSPFLQMAKQDHVRSQTQRGDKSSPS